MKNLITTVAALATLAFTYQPADACTGITLTAKDGARILSRTIEWGGSELNSQYVVVPRGYQQQSYIPGGKVDGLRFTARYGYVGLAVEQKEFVAEGLNEAGLSAGLFYFPRYGKYEDYQEANRTTSIADLQLVSWMLANFSTILASFQNSQLILNLGSDQYTEIKYFGRKVEFQYSNRNHQLNPILTQFTAGSRSSFLIISSTSAVHSTYVIRLLSVLHSLSLPETPLSIPMVLQVVSSSLLVLHFTPRTVSLVDMLEEGKQIALQWVPNVEAEAISGMPEVGTD